MRGRRNQEAEELERLTEEELIVNRGLFERKVAEQAEAVNVVVERQRGEGLRMDVIRERVLEHCWHSAATKPAVVAAIRAPIRVTNFPIPKESRMGRLASKVLLLRQAEMRQRAHLGLAEWSACLTTAAPVGQSAGADAAASGQAPAGGGSGGVSSGQAAATGGGQKGGAAAGGAKGAAAGSGAGGGSGQGSESNELQCATLTEGWAAGACQDSGMEGVLYDPLDLVPRSRRVVQVYLLYLRAAAAKEAFNKRFDAVVMEKHSDLERIREFNTRIREILADLDRLSDSKRNGTEEVWAPEMLEEEVSGARGSVSTSGKEPACSLLVRSPSSRCDALRVGPPTAGASPCHPVLRNRLCEKQALRMATLGLSARLTGSDSVDDDRGRGLGADQGFRSNVCPPRDRRTPSGCSRSRIRRSRWRST